jgi:hypothetical protein
VEEKPASCNWTVPSMTIPLVRTAVKDYENNNSRGESIDDKNYSIKVTERSARYCLISAFQLRDIRKFVLFFSESARSSCTLVASDFLINSSMLHSLENGLSENFSCIYATLASMMYQLRSNLLQSRSWAFTRIYGGRSRLLPSRSQF